MRTSLFRFRAAWLPILWISIFSLFLSACKKDEEEIDTTDYAARDEALITAYIADNKLTGFERDAETGLYYSITKPGSGANAVKNQKVTAKYVGTLLDGTVFDKSDPKTVGFPFVLGVGGVIKGWDVGFTKLNLGSKAILLIPSDMAYGKSGAGALIPPHAVLRFDVEVANIE
ncbi:FKBP-type peptidyl-prolyl cis-trans isomerase [Hymenobacter seoulensis]